MGWGIVLGRVDRPGRMAPRAKPARAPVAVAVRAKGPPRPGRKRAVRISRMSQAARMRETGKSRRPREAPKTKSSRVTRVFQWEIA